MFYQGHECKFDDKQIFYRYDRDAVFVSANEGFRVFTGYGFVDFDSPAAAQKAVASLKANGVQAQMAKVRVVFRFCLFCDHIFLCCCELKSEQEFAIIWIIFICQGKVRNPTIDLAQKNLSDLFHCFFVYIY